MQGSAMPTSSVFEIGERPASQTMSRACSPMSMPLPPMQESTTRVSLPSPRGRSDAEVVGITFLTTLYFNLAQVMAALKLDTEDPFVGWDLKGS